MLKTVKKFKLTDVPAHPDLKFWLSKTPEQRISAVEILRRQHYGRSKRLRKVVRIVKLKKH